MPDHSRHTVSRELLKGVRIVVELSPLDSLYISPNILAIIPDDLSKECKEVSAMCTSKRGNRCRHMVCICVALMVVHGIDMVDRARRAWHR